jgi:hypothetical protein
MSLELGQTEQLIFLTDALGLPMGEPQASSKIYPKNLIKSSGRMQILGGSPEQVREGRR